MVLPDGGGSSLPSMVWRTQNAKYRPAEHSKMLGGFEHLPKGRLKSVEAADCLAGRALTRLRAGSFQTGSTARRTSWLLTPEFLMDWNRDMLKEREHRQAHYKRRKVRQ